MKYAVIGELSFDTPAKRDTLLTNIKDKLAGKLTWGDVVVAKGLSREGKPNINAVIRFNTEADMNEVFAFIKDRMVKVPVLKGVVSKHFCTHDSTNEPCIIEEEFSK